MPWSELVLPAVELARNGFVIQAGLASNIIRSDTGFFVNEPAWAIDFAPKGTRLGFADTMTRKRYADVLETIAGRGADVFYTGPIASATVKALEKANGTMSIQDLQNYDVVIRESLSTTYRKFKLTSCGAPSSGTVALQIMKIIEHYVNIGDHESVNLSTHHLDEAIRFGYGSVSHAYSFFRGIIIDTNLFAPAHKVRRPSLCARPYQLPGFDAQYFDH